jgi:hypothetical protein
LKKLGRSYFKRASQCNDVQQCHIPLAAFDAAYIVPMEISEFCQLFLRESTLQPQLTDALAEYRSRIGVSHPAIIRT